MAQVVYYVACSADGFIAPEDRSLDWLEPFSGTGEDHGYSGFYSAVDALVVGSRTYEQMLTFGEWPHHDRPTTVASSRALPTVGDRVQLSGLGPRALVDSLEASGHRRIWLVGGGEFAGSFERADLIDEYVISYLPVILGSGVGLFGGRAEKRTLELAGQVSYDDGVMQCRYRR